MRGAPVSCVFMVMCQGLIPAHAGSTWVKNTWNAGVEAHPRACGEHPRSLRFSHLRPGSSPRMRGAPAAIVGTSQVIGLIPAHAGSTLRPQAFSLQVWAHPRACGEHHAGASVVAGGEGSSPRMRGALCHSQMKMGARGLIPAHAGSTGGWWCPGSFRRAHPRACGEHAAPGLGHEVHRGSSPRMRGAHPNHLPCRIRRGLIPAHAGSTTPMAKLSPTVRAHPRACGEHLPELGL